MDQVSDERTALAKKITAYIYLWLAFLVLVGIGIAVGWGAAFASFVSSAMFVLAENPERSAPK